MDIRQNMTLSINEFDIETNVARYFQVKRWNSGKQKVYKKGVQNTKSIIQQQHFSKCSENINIQYLQDMTFHKMEQVIKL